MTDRAKQLLLVVVAAAAVALVIYWMWPGGRGDQDQPGTAAQQTQPAGSQPLVISTEQMLADANREPTGGHTGGSPTGGAVEPLRAPKTQTAAGPDAAAALKLYQRGQELTDTGELIEARTVLSKALFSDKLPAADAAGARKLLASLAENTLFSPGFDVTDPYLLRYTVKAGDKLSRVERRLELHVPTQIICKTNRIDDPNKISAGQTLKLIKGPFHAVISLSNFTMDVYLHREGLPYLFIKRMPVGVGKKGVTPVGSWRVGLGRKMIKPPWNAPPNSGKKGTILYGQPGYPFGKKGLWIGLEGTDKNTRPLQGYGLHSTDDQASVGGQVSLGCVRLKDKDMELAFSLLYEKWSTVIIKK